MKLGFVRLLVSDYAASSRFYRDVMGFPVTWGTEESGYADFQTGSDSQIAIFVRQHMAEAAGTTALPANPECQDRSMFVFQSDDVDAEAERLRERGAQLVNEPQDRTGWGIRAAHLRDPDGYLIDIYTQLPQSEN